MKLLSLLKKNCKKYPNKIAINFYNKKINYKNFWENILIYFKFIKINKISKIVVIEDAGENEFYYVIFFASLMAKSTYIPISINTPRQRVQKIINLAKPCIVLSSKKERYKNTKNITPENVIEMKNLKIEKKIKSDVAYIIFTSGSTGEPKGVCVPRKALDHYVIWLSTEIFRKKNIKCPQFSRIGFDLSVVDIYGVLCTGNTLFPLNNIYDRTFINKFVYKNKINFWVSVPTAVEMFDLKKINELKSIKYFFFCGEPLKKDHLNKIFKINDKAIIFNTYGPTEATVSCSFIKLTKKNFHKFNFSNISFGKPIKNITFNLEGTNKKEGELLISGIQLANGYLNKIELTKKKFITKNNKKFYKTGDICKIVNNNYYFINREDSQVKIKGYRIELNEIDSIINKLFNTTAYSLITKDKIVTFIDKKISEKKLTSGLSKLLPHYMTPSKVIFIRRWPRNKNFKIDINKLMLLT